MKVRYEWNRMMIDLNAQPEEIKEIMDETILEALKRKHNSLVGTYFTKFCKVHGLDSIQKQVTSISTILMSSYQQNMAA